MRLFIAIELPPSVRRELSALQERLRPRCPGWRFVRAEGIHLTLRFLGEVDAARDAASRGAWREAAAASAAIRLRIGGLGVFPGAARPRVLWVGTNEASESAGRLEALARRMEEAARACGFPPETRPFRAHLTLARAGSGGPPALPPPDAGGCALDVRAEEAALIRSELRPDGARYSRIEAFPLGGGA